MLTDGLMDRMDGEGDKLLSLLRMKLVINQ